MKSRCRSVQRYLSDYIDFTLSGRQTVIVAQHLRSCQACQHEVESLRHTKALLHLYVPPNPPAGYDDLFWLQLQQGIEEHPRPIWWRTIVRWQSFVWGSQQFLDRCSRFLSSLISVPIQQVFQWVRLSPAYTIIFLITLTSLLTYQVFQPRQKDWFNATRLRQSLQAHPIYLTRVTVNREPISSSRKKIAGISPSFSEQSAPETPKLERQFGFAQVTTTSLDWKGYLSSAGGGGEAFNAVTNRDAFPDVLASAQLLTPESIVDRADFSLPLEGVITFPQFEREHRRLKSFIIEMLADVPLPVLSITEVYDSVKL
jgi:hypothetical protein